MVNRKKIDGSLDANLIHFAEELAREGKLIIEGINDEYYELPKGYILLYFSKKPVKRERILGTSEYDLIILAPVGDYSVGQVLKKLPAGCKDPEKVFKE
jgi:hypothetical protein